MSSLFLVAALAASPLSRREAGFFAVLASSAPAAALQRPTSLGSAQDAAALIRAECDPRWLDGIRSGSGALLYRGTVGLEAPALVSEPPDLFDAETYGSADAAAFFRRLEAELGDAPVRPSRGHIGVASSRDAARWGGPASVWPLGETHYAWRRARGRGDRATVFWPREPAAAPLDGLVVDAALGEALATGSEVLFSCANNRWVAVPLALEGELRAGLDLLKRKPALARAK